jgi:Fe-Mn family superoxide dismutase
MNIQKFELAPLPYDASALEPLISGKLLELHHDKHHNAYVTGANQTSEQIAEAREKDDVSKINLLTKNFTFNFAGHVNHSAFWENMTPPVKSVAAAQPGGTASETAGWINATSDSEFGGPVGALGAAIVEQFGSFERFKAQFLAAAVGVQGSGWVVLAEVNVPLAQTSGQPEKGALQILQLHDHQAELALGIKPIVLLDVWEHAYYLDYLNVRADYITSWWSLVNWEDANRRYLVA